MLFKHVLRLLLFPLRMRYSAGPPPTGAATTAPHLQEDLMERAVPTPPTTVREWAEGRTFLSASSQLMGLNFETP